VCDKEAPGRTARCGRAGATAYESEYGMSKDSDESGFNLAWILFPGSVFMMGDGISAFSGNHLLGSGQTLLGACVLAYCAFGIRKERRSRKSLQN
jgi:hypothetical protein